ncbi:MAG: lycopene cyclase domain-containing protein [Verrucomicrobiae bacterium]|nr:lycopene cyclase domain-containing protein [Verrucomicrobiae bacterium]
MGLTYLQFHLWFNLPLTLLLLFLAWKKIRSAHLLWAGAVLLIVFAFTSPWDNYAVFRNIWNFPEGRYSFRIGYLPLEEYLFFVFEAVNVMLLCILILARGKSLAPSTPKEQS